MSAIGDYIHYTARGYNKFGIGQHTVSKDYAIFSRQKQKIRQQMLAEANKTMSIAEKNRLQEALGKIISTKNNASEQQQIINKIQKELVQSLSQNLKDYQSAVIDFDTGNVSISSEESIALKKKVTLLGKLKNLDRETYFRYDAIKRRIQQIQNLITNDFVASAKSKEMLQSRLDTLNSMIAELEAQRHIYFKSSADLRPYEKVKNLVTYLNNTLSLIGAESTSNLAKGDFLEYAIGLAPLLCTQGGVEAINEEVFEELKKSVVGTTGRSTVKIDVEKFDTNVNWSQLAIENKGWQYDANNKVFMTCAPSQEKIDVMLQWENRQVPISAKNVNLSSGFDIHILSGSSLLYLLQLEDSNFVNHYINVISHHHMDRNNPYLEEIDNFSNLFHQAHEAAKITILMYALRGGTYGRDVAKIFVVNNNVSPEKPYIFDTAALVFKASNNIEAYSMITANGRDLNSLRLQNRWATTWEDRITRLIQDIHRQKIEAALKPSLLKI